MLSYILPPIIIIISVSILIMFLFRKSQQIPQQELSADDLEMQPKKRMAIIMSAIGQFGLRILERLIHKSKLLSLKFHNISNDWFHSIHDKRQRRITMQQEIIQAQELKENNENKKIIPQQPIQAVIDIQEQKPIRPLICEDVAHPQSIMKEKNQLEEVLIKRIAINPRDIEAYERLGDYYLESENYHDSKECFEQVLMLSPSHYKAKVKIRRIERFIK